MSDITISRDDRYNELQHHGILGMKWGVRRYQNKSGSLTNLGKKRYSSKDGSLNKRGKKEYDKETAKLKAEKKLLKNKARTQKKVDKLSDLKKEVEDLKKADNEAKAGESREEKRKRLLNSTDAKEIYENRSLLTTAELNDRINRIDTEARLASKIPEQKTGMDYINEKMGRASNTINNATNMFQKVDTAYSTVSKSAIGKELAKKLGIEPKKKEFNLDDFMNNINTKSNQEIQDARNRVQNERHLKTEQERRKKESNMSGDNNSNAGTGKSDETTGKTNSSSDKSNIFTGTVEGEGTSRYSEYGKDYVDNNPIWKDVTENSGVYADAVKTGAKYISGYLPYRK